MREFLGGHTSRGKGKETKIQMKDKENSRIVKIYFKIPSNERFFLIYFLKYYTMEIKYYKMKVLK